MPKYRDQQEFLLIFFVALLSLRVKKCTYVLPLWKGFISPWTDISQYLKILSAVSLKLDS